MKQDTALVELYIVVVLGIAALVAAFLINL